MIIRVGYLPFRIVAITICKWLIIAHKSAGKDIIVHEKVHQSEWSILWLIKYLLFPIFRMKAEVRAYAVQAKFNREPILNYKNTIQDCYLLSKRAKELLPEYIKDIENAKT